MRFGMLGKRKDRTGKVSFFDAEARRDPFFLFFTGGASDAAQTVQPSFQVIQAR